MIIHENMLHYYKDLLKLKKGEERSSESAEKCVIGLNNTIRVMNMARNGRICGEDFSDLDFGTIPLNKIHWSNEGKDPSVFDRCKLTHSNIKSGSFGEVCGAVFSADGRFLLTRSDDQYLTVWNVTTGLEKNTIETNSTIAFKTMSLSSDGEYCFLWDDKPNLRVYRVNDGKLITELGYDHGGSSDIRPYICITAFALSKDDKTCVLGDITGGVAIWDISDISTPVLMHRITVIDKAVTSVDISPSNNRIIVGHVFSFIIPYEIKGNKITKSKHLHFEGNYAKFIDDNTIMIWLQSGIYIYDLISHQRKRLCDSDDPYVYVFSRTGYDCKYHVDKNNHIIDIRSNNIVQTLGNGNYSHIAFSPDHKYCVTVERNEHDDATDDPVKLWDIESGKPIMSFKSYNHLSKQYVTSDDAVLFITHKNSAALFDLKKELWIGRVEANDILLKAWTGDNTAVELTGQAKPNYEDKGIFLTNADISGDGKVCLLGGNKLILWYPYSNEKYELLNGPVEQIVISEKGSYGLCVYGQYNILFDLKRRRIINKYHTFKRSDNPLLRCFSYDEKYLYILQTGYKLYKYETSTGECISDIKLFSHLSPNFKKNISQILISPDGNNLVAVWGKEKTMVNYDLTNNTVKELKLDLSIDGKVHITQKDVCFVFDGLTIYAIDIKTMTIISYVSIRYPTVSLSNHCFTGRYFITDGSGFIEVYRYTEEPNHGYELLGLMQFYNIDSLYIDNCSFKDCIADFQILYTLRHYGALL